MFQSFDDLVKKKFVKLVVCLIFLLKIDLTKNMIRLVVNFSSFPKLKYAKLRNFTLIKSILQKFREVNLFAIELIVCRLNGFHEFFGI